MPEDGRPVMVVVAHPDDETIGCGALLHHLRDVTLVVITDGAPRDMVDANARGFCDNAAYAAARAEELDAALGYAGCKAEVIRLGIADQEAARHLLPLSRRLAEIVADTRPAAVLTHAYEGGHPDHDAAAFASHMATRIAGCGCAMVEMPFYHLGSDGGMAAQRFAMPLDGETILDLPEPDRARKQRMIGAHRSQAQMLARFHAEAERYRPAPRYDFSALPNGGRLLYEQQNWGLTGAEWQALACAALEELRS